MDQPPEQAARLDPATVFRRYRDLLLHVGARKFHVPFEDAECLAQNVFLAYLKRASQVRFVRNWLVGAMVHASQTYWRKHDRTAPFPNDIEDWPAEESLNLLDRLTDRAALTQALARVGEKCRGVLVAHYFEGETLPELAAKRRTTAKTIKTNLYRCLRKLRAHYMGTP